MGGLNESGRLFAPFSAAVFDEGTQHGAAQAVVRLAAQPIGFAARRLRVGLSARDELARLLQDYKAGLSAELDGQAAAAALYFEEGRRHAELLWRAPERLAEAFAIDAAAPAQELASRTLEELLIDIHLHLACAMENGDVRGPRHLEHAEALLGMRGEGAPDALEEAVASRRVDELLGAERFAEAAAAACAFSDRAGRDAAWARRAADMVLLQLVKGLDSSGTEQGARQNVSHCERILPDLEARRKRRPWDFYLYAPLSDGRRLHAVALANSGRFAEALRMALLSIEYDPSSAPALQIHDQIRAEIERARTMIRDLEDQIRGQSNLRLSPQAENLKHEIARADALDMSKDTLAKRISAERRVALAHHIWREANQAPLQETAADDERAVALLSVVDRVPRGLTEADVHAMVAQELAAAPALAGVDPVAVSRLIVRLDGGAASPLSQAPPEDMLASYRAAAPSVQPANAAAREPLWAWFWSAREPRLKMATAAGAVLFLFALGGTGFDTLGDVTRDGAYREIVAAAEAGDSERVVAASRRFLGAPSFGGADDRASHVQVLAAAAGDNLVRGARDEAAMGLQAALDAGDLDAALGSAEAFLNNVSASVEDPRTEAVRTNYAQAMNAWLLQNPQSEEAETRVATFTRLMPEAEAAQ